MSGEDASASFCFSPTSHNVSFDYLAFMRYNEITKSYKGALPVQVTDVRVRLSGDQGPCKALASVVFDASFVLHEVRIVQGQSHMFVAMPRRKTAEGEHKDIAHPITADARETISKAVLVAYEAAVADAAVKAAAAQKDGRAG